MEVTSSNFKDLLPKIEEVISNASFIAIDCEFSGLNVVAEVNAFDTPKQYYEKVRKNCKDFLVLQYGISAFRFDSSINGFKQQTYNFYIFRRPINKNIRDQRFLCQTSSIHFLTSQGFDFNKLFKLGISYLNISEETEYRDKLEEQQKIRSNQNNSQSPSEIIPVPDDMKPMLEDILQQLQEFLDTEDEELELPKCNSFIRRLIYQTVGLKFKNKLTLQTKQVKNDRILVASKFKGKEEQMKIDRKIFEEELNTLDDFIGFTKVLRHIVDSDKLVIGHNMCLDFLHTVDKFLTPLSNDYEEFKECSHSLFKNILDTKYMANANEFKEFIPSTVLNDLLEVVSKDPFQMPAVEIESDGQGYLTQDPKEHEAGYDAFITGLCFLSMWNYLGKSKDMLPQDIFKDFSLLQPYLNKIYLMILRDNQYIHLGGDDSNPPRDHVFYLTFPKEWKLNNIIELFSPFGGVYVAWINETSAFVGLHKKQQASVALSTLSQSDTYSIMTYSKRQAQLTGIKAPQHSPMPSAPRKRTMENISKCNKRLKMENSFRGGFSRKIQPIIEDEESESDTSKKKSKTETAKTFIESETWD